MESQLLNPRQKQAARLLARGYSDITAAHILGIQRDLLSQWQIRLDFLEEVRALQTYYSAHQVLTRANA